nr:hypothetical protein [Lachnospiraceae bacterium]
MITILWMILAVLIALGIQFLVTFVFMGWSVFTSSLDVLSGKTQMTLNEFIERVISGMFDGTDNLMKINIVYAIVSIIVMIFWYRYLVSKNNDVRPEKKNVRLAMFIPALVALTISAQRITGYITLV